MCKVTDRLNGYTHFMTGKSKVTSIGSQNKLHTVLSKMCNLHKLVGFFSRYTNCVFTFHKT